MGPGYACQNMIEKVKKEKLNVNIAIIIVKLIFVLPLNTKLYIEPKKNEPKKVKKIVIKEIKSTE